MLNRNDIHLAVKINNAVVNTPSQSRKKSVEDIFLKVLVNNLRLYRKALRQPTKYPLAIKKLQSMIAQRREFASAELNRLVLPLENNRVNQTVMDIYEDIQQLKKMFPDVQLTHEGRVISVKTPTITLEHDGHEQSFDHFWINVGIRDMSYWVHTDTPNFAIGTEYIHPHIEGTRVCLGEAAQILPQLQADKKIFDLVENIYILLKTYNPDSPYKELNVWDKGRCANCEIVLHEGIEDIECIYCNLEMCTDCASICVDCDNSICGSHTMVCEDCEKLKCTECINETNKGGFVCSDCLFICNICNDYCNNIDTIQCTICNNKFCKDCVNDDVCVNCQKERDVKNEE